MRRTACLLHAASLGLLLLCTVAPAMARSGVNAAANGDGPCTETQDPATERARQTAESRNKALVPATAKPAVRSTGGGNAVTRGGGGDDASALRSHGAKWHSFLPGMFR